MKGKWDSLGLESLLTTNNDAWLHVRVAAT
jgi:hypothetical protein